MKPMSEQFPNAFVEEFVSRLRSIASHGGIKDLYYWLWTRQDDVADAAKKINEASVLRMHTNSSQIIPCLTVGSLSGLVWSQQIQAGSLTEIHWRISTARSLRSNTLN